MFESRISGGATEKLPESEKNSANVSVWPYDMDGHAKKCVERYCELTHKTIELLHEVSTPCLDDHQFKKEELETFGELSKSLLSNRPKMHVFGTHVVGNQTGTSSHKTDKRWWQTLNSFDFVQSQHERFQAVLIMWKTQQDSDFSGDLEDSKLTSSGNFYVSSGVERSFPQVGCARIKF